MSRQKTNQEIIELLELTNAKHQDLRFWQLLWLANVPDSNGGDLFYEESTDTLKRMKEALDKTA